MKKNTSPVFQKRLGSIRVAVFENTTDDDRVWHTCSCVRRYKDGDEWKDSTTLSGLGDIALAKAGLELAMDFIASLEQPAVLEDRE